MEVDGELIDRGEVAGASGLADDADSVSPCVRQVEGVGSKAACVPTQGIRGGYGDSRNIHPSKVLPHLNGEFRLIPATVREHGPGGVDHLIDVVNLGPDVAPPVRRFYLLVIVVFTHGGISAIQLVGAKTAAQGSEMCALADSARTGKRARLSDDGPLLGEEGWAG